jgi:hypothetical protein
MTIGCIGCRVDVAGVGCIGEAEPEGAEVADGMDFVIVPKDVTFRGGVRREGDFLVGELWLVYGGQAPRKITARVNLRDVVTALQQGSADPEISGLFDFVSKGVKSLGDAAKSVGRAKLVKGLARGVKSVVRSPITGAIVSVAAVAFPPIGMPAAAAYQASNAALKALDQRGSILDKLKAGGMQVVANNFGTPGTVPMLPPALMRMPKAAIEAVQQGNKAVNMIKDLKARAPTDSRARMQIAILQRVNDARKNIAARNADLVAVQKRTLPLPPRPMPPRPPQFPQQFRPQAFRPQAFQPQQFPQQFFPQFQPQQFQQQFQPQQFFPQFQPQQLPQQFQQFNRFWR